MRLEIENSDPIQLTNCKVLTIVPQKQPYSNVACCGINISLEFATEPESTKKYIADIISKVRTIKGWIIKDGNRIPVDIHGGNVGECYFGYINPTIFD